MRVHQGNSVSCLDKMYPLIRIIITVFCFINLAVCRDGKPFTLSGVFVSAFTPMDSAGNLNLTNIPEYASYVKKSGFDGVLLSSIAGEGPNLCVREKKSLYDAWMMYARPLRLKVILQVGGSSLPDVLELAAYADVLNVDAILVLPTAYSNKPSVEDLVSLMKDISRAAPTTPFLYYDLPEFSNVYVDMTKFFKPAVELIPQFRGILTNFSTSLEILATNEISNQRLFILGYMLLTGAVPNGFDSFIAIIPNIAPRLYLDIIRNAESRNFKEARELLLQLIALVRDITARSNFVSALKVATELTTGMSLGNPRKPLPQIDHKGRQYITSVLRKYDLRVANRYSY